MRISYAVQQRSGAAWHDARVKIVGRGEELARIDALLAAGAGGICFVGTAGMGRSTLAAEAERRAEALGYLLVASTDLAGDVPSATVIDDVHLLEPEALRTVSAIAIGRTRPIIMTMRAEPDARGPAITALWRDGVVERRDLRALPRDAIAEMCRGLLGASADASTLQRITELSGGSPRLVHELVLAAVETDSVAVSGKAASWTGPLRATPRLRDAVMSDAGLDGAIVELAELMAVSGGLDLQLAIDLLGLDVAEDAELRGIARVVVDGRRRRLVFAQAIVAEIVRDGMGQIRLARRAATLIEAAGPQRRTADELERTMWLVLVGREADVAAITEAARTSRLAGAPATAEWFARTAAATNDAGAVLELSECLYWQGRFREQIDLLERHPLPDAPPLLRALRSRQLTAAWFWGLGNRDVTMSIFDRVLEELGDDPAALDLLGHRAEARMFVGDFEAAIEDAEVVLAASEAEVIGRLSAFTGLVPALVLSGRVEDALARAPEGITLMLENPHTEFAGAGSFVGLCLGWFFSGRFDEVEDLVGGLYAESLLKSDDPLLGTWAVLLGRAAFGRGEMAMAISGLSEAAHLLDEYDPGRMLVWCLSLLSQAHAQRGDGEGAGDALEKAERVRVDTIRCYDIEIQLARAWNTVGSGARARARAFALAAADDACANRAWGVGALALHDAGRLGAQTGSRWSRIGPKVQGPLFAIMARAARGGDDANRVFSAAEQFEALGANLWAAETYASAARRYARLGDSPRLGVAQDRCLARVSLCGGARTPGLVDVDDLGRTGELSEREREIAQLAAQGLTNRAIAEELVLSVRTVENHLARALRKLGVNNRRSLVGFFGS